jgi:hypothetical protein
MVSILRLTPIVMGAMFTAGAGAAAAGQTSCRIERGVLLVPAQAAGLSGEFILDTGAARSILDATQATEASITSDTTTAPVRLAGRLFPAVAMDVAALDDRTRDFSTPITGVLGSDVLKGLVVEVRSDPCRLTLSRQGQPQTFAATSRTRLTMRGGVPFVWADVSDGTSSETGLFRLDTGADVAARFNPMAATIEPEGGGTASPLASLRALSIGGRLFENLSASLDKDISSPVMGVIGEPVWSRFAMRIDYRRRTLELAPARSR